jgi:hypothetical protein
VSGVEIELAEIQTATSLRRWSEQIPGSHLPVLVEDFVNAKIMGYGRLKDGRDMHFVPTKVSLHLKLLP